MHRRLQFAEIAPGSDFHAALVQHRGAGGGSGPMHSHDFWEAMYVLEGGGDHRVGSEGRPLQVGDLLLIRPPDIHAIRSRHGRSLLYVNVAFPESSWLSFCRIAGVENELVRWSQAAYPPVRTLVEPEREALAETFRTTLQAFVEGPSKLDLCRFFGELVRHLVCGDEPRVPDSRELPGWLLRAIEAMELPQNLRGGLGRLRELTGVSSAYLARTCKRELGLTPTSYLNDLRLKRASLLLRTTTWEIIDVAEECGFENLSYFYRLFRARYGCPPKAFRLMVGEQIAPRG